ncbi:MAG: hypothetical protein SCH98_14770 [Deferrisomatales bacterium]|nr:hypothetical protein [Deferrisomatales bacterium]
MRLRIRISCRRSIAISHDTRDGCFGDFRPGVGVGLPFLLPVGPAPSTYRREPKTRDREDRQVLHFSVGVAF